MKTSKSEIAIPIRKTFSAKYLNEIRMKCVELDISNAI